MNEILSLVNFFTILTALIILFGLFFYKNIFKLLKASITIKIIFWIIIFIAALASYLASIGKLHLKALNEATATNLSKNLLINLSYLNFKFDNLVEFFSENEENYIKATIKKDNQNYFLYINPKCSFLDGCVAKYSDVLISKINLKPNKDIFSKRFCNEELNRQGIGLKIAESFAKTLGDNLNAKLEIFNLEQAKYNILDVDYSIFNLDFKKSSSGYKYINSCVGDFILSIKNSMSLNNFNQLKMLFDEVQLINNEIVIKNRFHFGIFESQKDEYYYLGVTLSPNNYQNAMNFKD